MEESTLIATAALAISVTTLWLTLLSKGAVRMTQPTTIFFGPDGGYNRLSKVYFRTLLYATSKRGRIIENLYVRLTRGESHQNFNIWVYGSKELHRGSGLFVGEAGIAANHHFLLPKDDVYDFKAGHYTLEIYVRLAGDRDNKLLHTTALSISPSEADQLKQPDNGLYFDWGPDSKQYHSHISSKPPINKDDVDSFFKEILSL